MEAITTPVAVPPLLGLLSLAGVLATTFSNPGISLGKGVDDKPELAIGASFGGLVALDEKTLE